MKVKYIIDKNKDIKMVYTILKSNDPSGNQNRAEQMGIKKSLLELISRSSDFKEVKNEITDLYDEKYIKDRELLFSKKEEFGRGWIKVNDTFEQETSRIIGLPWQFDEYEVVVSLFHRGVSNMLGNTVYLWIYDDLDIHLRITAHELLMTHIWQYLFKNFREEEIYANWNRYWSINEITTTFVLGIEPKLNTLWSKRMRGYENFLQNYPQLLSNRDRLADNYKNRKSFKEYLDFALTLL